MAAKVEIQKIVGDQVRSRGTAAVARDLGLSREGVLAFAGGFPCRAGTDAQIEAAVARLGWTAALAA